MTDDEEYIQLTIPEAFVYKVPPRTSAQGHKASDWKDQVAIVKVVVVTRGKELALKLYRLDPDRLFAICPIRSTGPAGIEPVTDSSRYFCLRIEDGKGNHAFIGLGFNKREDAFDLKTALADSQKQLDAEEKGSVDLGIGELGTDFSLKKGETIAIKIGNKSGSSSSNSNNSSSSSSSSGTPGKLAAPGTIKLRAPGTAVSTATTTTTNNSNNNDPFGFSPAPAPFANSTSSSSSSTSATSGSDAGWETF